MVFNKIDAYKTPERESEEESGYSLEELKKTWMSKLNNTKCVFISAQNKDNIEELKEIIYSEVHRIFKVRYPYNNFLY